MMCLKQFGWDLGLVFCNNSIYVHIELFKIYTSKLKILQIIMWNIGMA